MSNMLNLKRFIFLLSDHISDKKNQYFLFSGIILSLFLLSIFIHLVWRQDLGIRVLVLGSSLAVILAPFVFDFKKTPSSYMLPASVFEKFLTNWTANIVLIPLLSLVIGLVCCLIGCMLFENYIPFSNITPRPNLINVWLRLAGIQSVVFLGQSAFRKYILAKTMLIGILLFTLLIICLKIVIFFDDEPFEIESSSYHIICLKFLFVVSMWVISYFSIKKVQL